MVTKKKQNKLAKLNEVATALAPTTEAESQLAAVDGLTEQQKTILRLKTRKLSQKAIAGMLDVTPARISQEVKAIREHFVARGSVVNQAALVGETMNIFEEVEKEAWGVFHSDDAKKLAALDRVMGAREKTVKMLMDLGLIKRAATEHIHKEAKSEVMENLTPERREAIVAQVINVAPGVEPEPPEEDYDEDYDSGEVDTGSEDEGS